MARQSGVSRSRKRDLSQPDEFISLTTKIINYFKDHIKAVIVVLCAVTAAGVSLLLILHYGNVNNQEAFKLLSEAQTEYQKSAEEDPVKAYEASNELFEQIFEKHPKTSGARSGYLIYANICYKAGEYDKAINYYNKALNKFQGKTGIEEAVYSGLAYAYRDQANYDKAAGYFDKLTSTENKTLQEEAYYNLGLIYEETNNPEKSRKAFKTIVDEFTGSMYFEIAKQKVG